ncbi:hypothetical protein Bca52824_062822 [Brassica carinata]|uniref:Uncharacterized protein n=1 Tax=Brassica carinata TaxID=52824 RepID=A0A8X7QDL2_BRACI|nr:hypothetical protein Bca52824_062822 [Brassica carinata]
MIILRCCKVQRPVVVKIRFIQNTILNGVSISLAHSLDPSDEDLENFKSFIHHSKKQSILAIHAHIFNTFRRCYEALYHKIHVPS